jgi:hypothetical protein
MSFPLRRVTMLMDKVACFLVDKLLSMLAFPKVISVCLCKPNSYEQSCFLSVHYITLPIT